MESLMKLKIISWLTPIAPVVTTIKNLTLSSMSSKFVKNTRGNYSGADQSVGPATILRRYGLRIIPFEKLADLSKQTGVILGNLKKITRSTLEKKWKNYFPTTLKKYPRKVIVLFFWGALAVRGKFSDKCKRGLFF